MKCPSCHNPDTKVLDSRAVAGGLVIRRRRECLKCTFRFSTHEEVELLNMVVVKRNGDRMPYHREKIENGLRRALEKRPVTAEDFHQLVARIEHEMQLKARKDEIPTFQIGEIVMKHLRKIDQVAYIRFASVYKSFQDTESFLRELQRLHPVRPATRVSKKK